VSLPAALRTRIAIVALLGAGYFATAHLTSTVAGHEWLGVAVGVGVLYAFAGMLCWHTRWRLPTLAAGALGIALIVTEWPLLKANFTWFYLLEHAGSNALLALLFGATLKADRVPLCTRLAQMVHGEALPAAVDRYTRRITVAWTLFFALSASASLLLYLLAPIEVWSTYANLLTAPLVALMFVAEYAVRVRVLPPSHHSTIAASVAAFWIRQYGSERSSGAPSH
jgi:uncharacterized membrane protein